MGRKYRGESQLGLVQQEIPHFILLLPLVFTHTLLPGSFLCLNSLSCSGPLSSVLCPVTEAPPPTPEASCLFSFSQLPIATCPIPLQMLLLWQGAWSPHVVLVTVPRITGHLALGTCSVGFATYLLVCGHLWLASCLLWLSEPVVLREPEAPRGMAQPWSF